MLNKQIDDMEVTDADRRLLILCSVWAILSVLCGIFVIITLIIDKTAIKLIGFWVFLLLNEFVIDIMIIIINISDNKRV